MNVFSDFFINYLFIIILVGIFILQLFIVEYGGETFQLVPLTLSQHLHCIMIGISGVIWNAIVKVLIPDSFMNNFSLLREDRNLEIMNVDSIF